jgi:Icc-related predicted phosphoesterase
MKILYTSDIHAGKNHLASMLTVAKKASVDGIIIGGDIVPHHLPGTQTIGLVDAQAAYLNNVFIPTLQTFKAGHHIPLYLDMANDDLACNRDILEQYSGNLLHLLHMEKHRLTDSMDIIGYMNVPPTPFHRKDWEKPDSRDWPYAPDGYVALSGVQSHGGTIKETHIEIDSTDTIENDLKRLSAHVDRPFVFVSHTPPYNTPLDVISDGTHVGSMSIRNFIAKWSAVDLIKVSLHGHIHESPKRSGFIQAEISGVLCINPGQGNGDRSAFQYAMLRINEDSHGGIQVSVTEQQTS